MRIISLIAAFLMVLAAPLTAAEKIDKLVIAGPRAPVTPPLAYIIEAGLLDSVAEKVELRVWKNTDQLRALIIGKEAHFAATPAHLAAKLYNKGVPIRLMNVSVWGDLWIMSSDPNIKSISDLAGKEMSMSGKNGTPDILFSLLADKLGVKDDIKVSFVPNMVAALTEIGSGRAEHALLSEPHATRALTLSADKERKLYRAVGISQQWGEVLNTTPRIARAGVSALPKIMNRPDVIEAFQTAYKEATDWCVANPEKAGEIAAKYVDGFKAPSVAMSLSTGAVEFVSAQDGKADIMKYFQVILDAKPKGIGGKLPDDGLFWSAK